MIKYDVFNFDDSVILNLPEYSKGRTLAERVEASISGNNPDCKSNAAAPIQHDMAKAYQCAACGTCSYDCNHCSNPDCNWTDNKPLAQELIDGATARLDYAKSINFRCTCSTSAGAIHDPLCPALLKPFGPPMTIEERAKRDLPDARVDEPAPQHKVAVFDFSKYSHSHNAIRNILNRSLKTLQSGTHDIGHVQTNVHDCFYHLDLIAPQANTVSQHYNTARVDGTNAMPQLFQCEIATFNLVRNRLLEKLAAIKSSSLSANCVKILANEIATTFDLLQDSRPVEPLFVCNKSVYDDVRKVVGNILQDVGTVYTDEVRRVLQALNRLDA